MRPLFRSVFKSNSVVDPTQGLGHEFLPGQPFFFLNQNDIILVKKDK
jgi:hypothetical protein